MGSILDEDAEHTGEASYNVGVVAGFIAFIRVGLEYSDMVFLCWLSSFVSTPLSSLYNLRLYLQTILFYDINVRLVVTQQFESEGGC